MSGSGMTGNVPRVRVRARESRGGVRGGGPGVDSGDVFDHLDELVDGVSLSTRELDQFPHSLDDGAAFGCSGDCDSAPAAKLEQPFVLKEP
jgi:hypothetical protein